MKYYKFVNWDAAPIEEVLNDRLPTALQAADAGDIKPLKDLHIVTQNAIYKRGGWAFSYREYMRRFWVKTKYYGIIEVYALNKTDIRKEYKSAVLKIIEAA